MADSQPTEFFFLNLFSLNDWPHGWYQLLSSHFWHRRLRVLDWSFFLFCTDPPTDNSFQFSVIRKFLFCNKLINDNKCEIDISDLAKFHFQLFFKPRLFISTAKWHTHFSHFLMYFLIFPVFQLWTRPVMRFHYLEDRLAYQRKICLILPIFIRPMLYLIKFFNYFSVWSVFFPWFFLFVCF